MEINVKTSMEINVKTLEITFLPSPRTLHSVVQLGGGQSGLHPPQHISPPLATHRAKFSTIEKLSFFGLKHSKESFSKLLRIISCVDIMVSFVIIIYFVVCYYYFCSGLLV